MKQVQGYAPTLKTEIHDYISVHKKTSRSAGYWQADFLDKLLPFATAGKLLRGSLVCFSYEAFTDKHLNKQVLNTAVALELVHSALLIHDDVMDDDDFRRGKPSLHNQYKSTGLKTGALDPKRFGANMAICAGDMCLFLAFSLASKATQTVRPLFTDMLMKVCEGQMQDIYLQSQPTAPTKRSIYDLMKTKTAAYTVSLPLMAGAVLADQSPATLRKLERLGDAIGVIFQIRDDELGVIGDTTKTGKPVGADIREGKKTLIYYYLMKKSSRPEKHKLESIFGNLSATTSDITFVQKLIRKYRLSRLLNEEVQRLEDSALQIVETLNLSNINKAELKSLIAFCAQRQA